MRERGKNPVGGAADWVSQVAERTAAEAGVSVQLLGEHLQILSDAATQGRRPQPSQLNALRQLGELTAVAGVDADRAVDVYLSAAWRLWRAMPATVGHASGGTKAAAETMLRVVNEAVDVLIDGHQAARRAMIRQEESVRREFIDDLLRGDADVARLIQRASRSDSTSAGATRFSSPNPRPRPRPSWTGGQPDRACRGRSLRRP
jgi:hypothetical protein